MDLIKRSDAVLEIQALMKSISDEPYRAAIVAINAIPAVSGEAVGTIRGDSCDMTGKDYWIFTPNEFSNKPIFEDYEVYTTPQDQSARIADLEHDLESYVAETGRLATEVMKLEAQLARYEVVATYYCSINNGLYGIHWTKNAHPKDGTKLFALKD